MISIFNGSTDVTQYVKQRSVKITDQMGNRKNTAAFTLLQGDGIDQGRAVRIYETLDLRQSSSSGTAVLYVTDTYQAQNKWKATDEIIVDIRGTEKKYIISSVDHSAKTITLTTNLSTTVTKGTHKVGRLVFGGVCISNPDEEIGVTGTFEQDIKCVDWTNLYDRKVVVQQYEDMYAREIIGRIVYFFCPTDTMADIDDFESAWTQGGNGSAMSNETTDRIHKTRSQKTGTSASGSSTWAKTISSTDYSAYTHARFWWKATDGNAGKITAMKLRLGTDASNYFEWDIDNIGSAFDSCWNYESVELANYDTSTGSPNLAAIQWAQIAITTSAAITANTLFFDHLFASTGSFTLKNTARGDTLFGDVRVQYKKASSITEELAKQSGLFWYIDYERDIHLFTATTTAAPWGITDTSENYWDMTVEVDISKLKNRQIVRGGEAPSETLYTQTNIADGSQTSFALDYKPQTLTMTVAGTPQTIGVEGFVDETTVSWVWNFSEKIIRKTAAGSTPTNGQAVVFTYYPYQPIRVSVTSPTSIATMAALTGGDGIYDGELINDPSLSSFADARARARAELTAWANAIVTIKFHTEYDGLRAGQSISIVDASRSISDSYLIQSVQWQQKHDDRWVYSVQASSTLFGLIEFIQMLLKRSNRVDISPSEIVDTILNVDQTVTITPVVTPTAASKTVYAALKKTQWIDFVGLSGTTSSSAIVDSAKQWYAEFSGSETGTAQFTTSRHNNNAELRLTTAVGGNGKELQVRTVHRLAAVSATSYTVQAWIELQAALTNVGTGGGFQMVIKEWAAQTGGSALATNTIFSAKTAAQDFNKVSATFTSNASTAWISIEISLYRAIGTARLTDITITPATAETATLAAQASFAQAT